MIKLNQIYKCSICGNIVQVLHAGGGQLICCGKQMELLKEKTKDVGAEKHVPVIEETKEGVKVKIGLVSHPMEEKHFIEWIEILTRQGKIFRKYLKPGQAPEAEFCVKSQNIETVREYCNIHGLWKRV